MSHFIRPSLLTLRDLTPARVSLPMAGNSIANDEVLRFQLAHAEARDAVHAALHMPSFAQRLVQELPILAENSISVVHLSTNAPNRIKYLQNPNLGRTLLPDSALLLCHGSFDLAIIIADGLSAVAIERNAIVLLSYLLPKLLAGKWTIAPIAVAQQARVAIGDPIGHRLGARCSLVLIGERPGLSSADSMGAYLTCSPHPNRTDADRNCLSNIRSGGLSPELGADRLLWLLQAARGTGRTGTSLKEAAPNLLKAAP